jgi:hypothetical protein
LPYAGFFAPARAWPLRSAQQQTLFIIEQRSDIVSDAAPFTPAVALASPPAARAHNSPDGACAMTVNNVHHRIFPKHASATLSTLVDGLGQRGDRLWPAEVWPALCLDRPLGVGADGGHGPIRYAVAAYEPGKLVRFGFKAPAGFDGYHCLEVIEHDSQVELRHTLRMTPRGVAKLTWPLIFRPLHDALLEDAMAKAERAVGVPPAWVPWTGWVRLLRCVLGRGRARRQLELRSMPARH